MSPLLKWFIIPKTRCTQTWSTLEINCFTPVTMSCFTPVTRSIGSLVQYFAYCWFILRLSCLSRGLHRHWLFSSMENSYFFIYDNDNCSILHIFFIYRQLPKFFVETQLLRNITVLISLFSNIGVYKTDSIDIKLLNKQ